MERFIFWVDGARAFIYSQFGEDDDVHRRCELLTDGELAVVIYPEREADFFVECFDKSGGEIREPYIALAVLSHFFSRVRGLPDITFDVLYRGNFCELVVSGDAVKFSVNVGKCKLLCTKTAIFSDGVEIYADLISLGSEVVSVVCTDSDLFDHARLALLPEILGMRVGAPALAVSFDGEMRIRTTRDIPYYDAVAVGAFSLLERGTDIPGGRLTAHVNGRCYTFSLSDGVLTFYPDIKYLY